MIDFLKKNGFYIMLGVCVLCVAGMIIVGVTAGNEIEELKKPKVTASPSPSPSVLPSPSPSVSPSPSPLPSPSANPTDAEPVELAVPVEDAVIGLDFSVTSFVFSETLNQWQVHTGIDFLTEEPKEVKAVTDGTVEEVNLSDVLNGGTVVINHGNGLKSVYMSLGQDVTVAVGDEVQKGDVIGMTSASAYSEFKSGNHLHFELLKDDEPIDPNGYFPAK